MEYGLIPEFIGRLPVVAAIHQLTRDDLITILTEPRNALTRQFQRFFQFDDIELVFAARLAHAIADKALEREAGARGLRSILEETLLDVQFELPSRARRPKCVVTKETIEKGQAHAGHRRHPTSTRPCSRIRRSGSRRLRRRPLSIGGRVTARRISSPLAGARVEGGIRRQPPELSRTGC